MDTGIDISMPCHGSHGMFDFGFDQVEIEARIGVDACAWILLASFAGSACGTCCRPSSGTGAQCLERSHGGVRLLRLLILYSPMTGASFAFQLTIERGKMKQEP